MFFILQKEKEHIDNLEVFVLKELLDHQKFVHQYTTMSLEEIKERSTLKEEAVPVGSIQFVQEYLSARHNMHHMNAIEVPSVLRHDKFLKRRYSLIEKSELPRTGYHFTKYASGLKDFYHVGTPDTLKRDVGTLNLKDGIYQVSEVVEILSEYRCFISQDEILGIQFYNGDCTVLPSAKDVELLKEMVIRYTVDKTRPLAYTLDVAMIKDRGLAVIECHPHTSVGLYGLYGNFLPYCYKFGFEWYVKHNTPIQPFSNFDTFQKE